MPVTLQPVAAAILSAGPPAPLAMSSSVRPGPRFSRRMKPSCSAAVIQLCWPMSSPNASRRISA